MLRIVSEPGTGPGCVFISYVREDAVHVDRLQRILEAAGITVWRDSADLWPGQDWRAHIRSAITDSALVFLACFSRQSVSRPSSYQDHEIALAAEQLRVSGADWQWLIPVRFDDCEIPDREIGHGRRLSSIQAADLFGDDTAAAAARLAVTIWRILSRTPRSDPWYFPGTTAITIACAEYPQEMAERVPYSRPRDPFYTEGTKYADRDSLQVLSRHIARLNPAAEVRDRAPSMLSADDYHTHLVALGGIDFNTLTRRLLNTLGLPVRQVADWQSHGGQYFEVDGANGVTRHRPVTEECRFGDTLHEDVALFARVASPFRHGCTLTICCGMHTPGTFGVVRALTDDAVRDRNISFLRSRFGTSDTYCVLTQIPVADGRSVPPDWTVSTNILYTWSR